MKPHLCRFCGKSPTVASLTVMYETARRVGQHEMHRVECECGAHGKCRPTPTDAAVSWNEPWQARPETAVLLADAEKAMADFCAKVDRGEARSKRSYALFSAVLERIYGRRR